MNQHHQTLKHGTTGEASTSAASADIVSSYGSVHHQTLAAAAGALFDHQASSSSTSPYQPSVAHAQLHSPFGVLPHESVLNGGAATTQKVSATLPFENTYNAHGGAQTLNRSHEVNVSALSDYNQENVIINASNKKSDKTVDLTSVKTTHIVSQSSPSEVKSVGSNILYHSSGGLQPQHQVVQPTPASASKYACKCGLNCGNLRCCQSQRVIMGPDSVSTSPSSNSVINSNSAGTSGFHNVNKSCVQSSTLLLNNSPKSSLSVASTAVDKRLTSSDVPQGEQCSSGQSSPVCFAVTTMPSVHRPIANYNSNSVNSGSSLPAGSSPRNVISSPQFHSPHRLVVSPVQYCQNSPLVKSSPTDMIGQSVVSVTQKSPDCAGVVVPRMPSPLQAHLQSSPLGHASSPTYPMYNSPVMSINSPTQQQISISSIAAAQCQQQQNYSVKQPLNIKESLVESLLPLDVTVQRRSINEFLSEKGFGNTHSDCAVSSNSRTLPWESVSADRDQLNNNNCRKSGAVNLSAYGTGLIERNVQQMEYFDCRVARSVGVGQVSENAKSSISNEKKETVSCGAVSSNISSLVNKQKKSLEKDFDVNSEAVGLNLPIMGRIPPPAHNSSNNSSGNLQQNDSYFDCDRWNFSGSMKNINGRQSLSSNFVEQNNKNSGSNFFNSENQNNQSLNLPSTQLYPSSYSQLPTLPQSSSFYNNLPSSSNNSGVNVSLNSQCESRTNDLQNTNGELAADTTEASVSSKSPTFEATVDEQPKVIVPNIEEELDFLNDCALPVSSSVIPKQMSTAMVPDKKISNASTGGFMESYLKFLQGERDTSTPTLVRNNRRAPYTKTQLVTSSLISSNVTKTSSPSPNVTSQSRSSTPPAYDPEDDPRYFPLPKTSAHRGSLDSSDDELDNGEFSYFKKTSSNVTNVSSNDKTETANNEMKETSSLSVPSISDDAKSDSKKDNEIVPENHDNEYSNIDDMNGSNKNSNKSKKSAKTMINKKNKKSASKSVKKRIRRRNQLSEDDGLYFIFSYLFKYLTFN